MSHTRGAADVPKNKNRPQRPKNYRIEVEFEFYVNYILGLSTRM